MVETKTLLEFLSEWKTKQQICDEFNLSFQESYHLLNWSVKANLIKRREVTTEERKEQGMWDKGKIFIYKAMEGALNADD